MALTEDTIRASRPDQEGLNLILANGDTAYQGSFMSGEPSTGHMTVHTDASDRFFIGMFNQGEGGASGDGSAEFGLASGRTVLYDVSVTGFTAESNAYSLVYATDDDTLTLSRPNDDATPVGFTLKYNGNSGQGDVALCSFMDSCLLSMTQRGKKVVPLGSWPLSAASGDLITDLPMYGHFTIERWGVVSDGDAASGGTGDVDWTLDIGSSEVTGAELAIVQGGSPDVDTQGANLTASPSSGNEVWDGDTISLRVKTVTTAYTAGRVWAYMEIQMHP